MAIYLQIDGIHDDTSSTDHGKWMDIEQMKWNISRNMHPVADMGIEDEPTISNVTLTRVRDDFSTRLFEESCAARNRRKAVIHLVTIRSPGETHIEYTLENTLIANYSVDSSGDRPIETIRLNFTGMQVKQDFPPITGPDPTSPLGPVGW
ncbi:MAG: type VI secretion system tube protein Hcp [Alphaproteobacteria bacterium]|nr:type VI secretion system tube protein Hcp [Alphaproteobacteria bacterium]